MRPHPYLRAYMAGILVPTLFLIVILAVLTFYRFYLYLEVPSQFILGLPARPLERAIVFPMAVVPNLWGVWNMVHLATKSRTHLPIGPHGCGDQGPRRGREWIHCTLHVGAPRRRVRPGAQRARTGGRRRRRREVREAGAAA